MGLVRAIGRLVALALVASLLPSGTASAQEPDPAAEVKSTITVEAQGAVSWTGSAWSSSVSCLAASAEFAGCSIDLSGTWEALPPPPEGTATGLGCFEKRTSADGAGSMVGWDLYSGEPVQTFQISDLGWEVAAGTTSTLFGGEYAAVKGRWRRDGREGRIGGVLWASYSTSDCTYSSIQAVLQFFPSSAGGDSEWDNSPPDAPGLVSPATGHEFAPTDDKTFTVSVGDVDGDASYSEIAVTHLDGPFSTTLRTSPTASGAQASASAPWLGRGSYSWTARSCDVGGSGKCGPWSSPARTFTVAASTVDEVGDAADEEAESAVSVHMSGSVYWTGSEWSTAGYCTSTSSEWSGGCTFDVAGTWDAAPPPPEGTATGLGCFEKRTGDDGAGRLQGWEYGYYSYQLVDSIEITDFGWDIAAGSYTILTGGEYAVVKGRWSQDGREGRIEGLVWSSNSSSDCAWSSVQFAVQFLPATAGDNPQLDNQPPAAPELLAPAGGQHFDRMEEKRFTAAAGDPDQDPVYSEFEVARTDGSFTHRVAVPPAAMGENPTLTVSPGALEPGEYTWTVRACDPSGSGDCGPWVTPARAFTVEPSTVDDTGEAVGEELDSVITVIGQGYVYWTGTSWTPYVSCLSAGTGLSGGCGFVVDGTWQETPPPPEGTATGLGCFEKRTSDDGAGSLVGWDSITGETVTIQISDFGWQTAAGSNTILTGGEHAVLNGRWRQGDREGRIEGALWSSGTWSDCTYSNVWMEIELVPPSAGENVKWDNEPPRTPRLVVPEADHAFSAQDEKRFAVEVSDPDEDYAYAEVAITHVDGPFSATLRTPPTVSGSQAALVAPWLGRGSYTWRSRACDLNGSGKCGPWSASRAFTVRPSPADVAGDEAQNEARLARSVASYGSYSWSWSSTGWQTSNGCTATDVRWSYCTIDLAGDWEQAAAPPDGAATGLGCFEQRIGRDGTGTLRGWDAWNYYEPIDIIEITDFGWDTAAGTRESLFGGEYVALRGRWRQGDREGRIDGAAWSNWSASGCSYSNVTFALQLVPDDIGETPADEAAPAAPVLVRPAANQTLTATDAQTFRVTATDPNDDFYLAEIELTKADGSLAFPAPIPPTFTTSPALSGADAEAIPPAPLAEGGYRWRARAKDPTGSDAWGPWSAWSQFTVTAQVAPPMILASSDQAGLERFYPYRDWDLGRAKAYANLATGNLVVQGVGLEAPGSGLNLRVTHTYNSAHDAVGGAIGRGWTLGIVDGDGLLEGLVSSLLSVDVSRVAEIVGTEDSFDFTDADGTRHHFVKGGLAGPGWHSPPGVDLTMVDGVDELGMRWYDAVRPDGVRYEFRLIGASYRLLRIADRKGNGLAFTYASGRLSTVSDGVGRTLTVIWSGGRIATVRYSAAGSTFDVNYTVDATTGRLTSLTRAAGSTVPQTTSFSYASGQGLTGVIDARGNTTGFAYGAEGRLVAVTDRAGKPWQLTYGLACESTTTAGVTATCVVDPEGHPTTYLTSDVGNLLELRDAGDIDEAGAPRRNASTYVWAAHRLRKATDPAGNTTEYDYNALGQIARQRFTGAGEQTVVSEFDYTPVGKGVADLTQSRAGVGTPDVRIHKFVYDTGGKGLLTSETDPTGATTLFTYYGVRGLLKTVTDPRGATVTYGVTTAADGMYHLSGQPTRITDPTGAATTLTYDFLGRLTQKVDRLGKTWTNSYDLRGNLLAASNPLSQVTRRCYDGNDNPVVEIRPLAASTACTQTGTEGHVTRTDYDPRDLPTVTTTSSDGQLRRTKTVYADDGQPMHVLMPRTFHAITGAETTDLTQVQKVVTEYHPNNHVKAFTDPEGNRTDIVHTANGLVRRVTEPGTGAQRRTTTTTYNGQGQETAVLVSGHSAPTRTEYNLFGEPVRTTSPKGVVTQMAYDAARRLVRITDAQGRVSQRTYDPAGNLVAVTQPAAVGGTLSTAYTYTLRGEIASETDPSDTTHTVTYTYDAEGRQTHRHDRTNGTIKRTVQEIRRDDGKVAERVATYAGTSTGKHRTTFAYNANGDTTAIKTYLDNASTPNVSDIAIAYTTAGEPKTWTEILFNTAGTGVTRTSTFAYERDGALASRTVDGLTTTYTHLRNGLEQTTTPWGPVGQATSSWLPDGALSAQTLPNGATASYTYDPAGRITSKIVAKAGASLSAWQQIVYDEDDNRTGELVSQAQPEGGQLAGSATFAYDTLGRLVSAKHPFEAKAKTYVLDDAGNIRSDTEAAYEYTWNRLTSMQPLPVGSKVTFAYDPQGNMAAQKAGTTATSFTYDAAGHPRRTTSPDGTWVEYLYDGLDRMVRRTDSTGETRLFYRHGGTEAIALETDQGGMTKIRYVLDSEGTPLGQEIVGTGLGWYVTDLRDNLTQLLDSTGAVKAVYAYDPFGKDKTTLTKKEAGWDSRLRYQLAPRDMKNGTYNLGPRLYDPAISRFVGADSYVSAVANVALATDPLTGNRYLYAGCNPLGMTDDGHAPKKKGNKKALDKPAPKKRTTVRCTTVTAAGLAATFLFFFAAALAPPVGLAAVAGAIGGIVSGGAVWQAQRRLKCSSWITSFSM